MVTRLVIVAVALLLVPLHAQELDTQEPNFRARVDAVSFGVTVLGDDDRLLSDLRAEDFEVREDGRLQTVAYFARGDDAAAVDVHVGLLLDTSGSMGADIRLARSAAISFLNRLSDARDMTLVDFDSEVRVTTFGQQDFPRMVERIRARTPDGLTALYDALGVYLDGAAENEGRTVLVLFTDGGDTRSVIGFSDVMTLLKASDVTAYTVGFLEHQPSFVRNEQRLRLSQIAGVTGGQAFFPYSMDQIDEAFDTVLAQIHAQYTIGYTSSNTTHDGRWRDVEIRVRRPDADDLHVRTRKGYFAPYVLQEP